MSESNIKVNPANLQIKEISILFVIRFLKKYFLKLFTVATICAVLGYLSSYLFTPMYKAETILLPEYGTGTSLSLVSMAMGLKASEGADNLVPELYPSILKSYPFGIYLLKQPVTDQDNKNYPTLDEYLKQTSKPSLITNILSFSIRKIPNKTVPKLKDPEILTFTTQQKSEIESAMNLARATLEKTSQTIKIVSEMEDPVVAALIAEAGKTYLISYVEDYRSEKTSQNATFLLERVAESKKRLQSAEYNLQSYRDRNRNTFLNVARIEEQRLQSEYTVSQSLYSDLVQKLEQAKIKVKQEKPVFKVLEPVQVPLITSSPRRVVISVLAGLLGGLITLAYLIIFKEKLLGNLYEE